MDTGIWPSSEKGYKLECAIGCGSFGIVWKAKCLDGSYKNTFVAIKIIDLEQFPSSSIEEIRREISIMSTSKHENVVSYHVSFITGSEIWLVMPILDGGSCLDIMKYKFKSGMPDESVVATILHESLKGLVYFHQNGQIHRDIKAGNILVDKNGKIFIGDFGVAAHLKEGKKRQTFVGTPCWMAPEVMEQIGYDFKADIWSFGITAIELAEGEAPYSNLTAMKVILSVLNNDPPNLKHPKNWDPLFGSLIKACLQKSPEKRPTAEQLLVMFKKLFIKSKDSTYLKELLLKDIPEIENRVPDPIKKMAEEFIREREKKKKQASIAVKDKVIWDFEGDQEEVKETIKISQSKVEPKKEPEIRKEVESKKEIEIKKEAEIKKEKKNDEKPRKERKDKDASKTKESSKDIDKDSSKNKSNKKAKDENGKLTKQVTDLKIDDTKKEIIKSPSFYKKAQTHIDVIKGDDDDPFADFDEAES